MRSYVILHSPGKDGSTLYEHCLAVQKITGDWPKEYPLPEVPTGGADAWDWYWQIRQAVPYGFSGPGPLLYSEIDAWARLLDIQIEPRDVRFLMILDQQYMESWYANQKKQADKQK